MALAGPIFMIFAKTDWKNKRDIAPISLQISLEGFDIHVTAHFDNYSVAARMHSKNRNNSTSYKTTNSVYLIR